MSVFEQLRQFVGLCQACGMIPYTIENNLITNKFSRFTFSVKHRTTWWFACILAFKFVSMCLTGYYSENRPDNISTDRSLPITVNILFAVNSSGTLLFNYYCLAGSWCTTVGCELLSKPCKKSSGFSERNSWRSTRARLRHDFLSALF